MGVGMETKTTECDISEDEAALYDRQIRLWGLDAQKRLRSSRILMVGVGGLGAEVTKNLVLAGIKSVTLADDKNVSDLDATSQFLVSPNDIGKNRAECSESYTKHLNPMVDVVTYTGSIMDKDDEFFKNFDVVCASGYPVDVYINLNSVCRRLSLKFYCGDVWGYFGYCFSDLGYHTYLEEMVHFTDKIERDGGEPLSKKPRQSERVLQMHKKSIEFVPLEKSLAVKSGKSGTGLDKRTSPVFLLLHVLFRFHKKHKRQPLPDYRDNDIEDLCQLKEETLSELGIDKNQCPNTFFSHVFGELSPVCAVVGGVLAQEIIKAVSEKDAPIKNFFLFDGEDGSGIVENISR